MTKAVEEWTDARLNHLAAAIEPMPARVAALAATVEHMDHVAAQLEPVPAQLAVIAAAVERLGDDNRALREDLTATQLQLVQIAWGLVAALLAAAGAMVAALL